MSREWKPGDVVAWRVDAESYNDRESMVALLDELIAWWPERPRDVVGVAAGTSVLRFLKKALMGAQVGDLVVIDPGDREQVERLTKALVEAAFKHDNLPVAHNGIHGDTTALALREFANPTPPKPDEPQGLGAVVEDADGQRWIRHGSGPAPWMLAGASPDNRDTCRYAELGNIVSVLSAGYTEGES